MNTSGKPYKPIDCNYYDRLEAWATQQAACRIVYIDESGHQQVVSVRIQDLYTVDKVEYMKMDNGLVIRLDSLLSVNDIPLPDHC